MGKNIYQMVKKSQSTKLSIVCKKIWFFSALLTISGISFFVWIGNCKIEMKISAFLKKGEAGTKLIVNCEKINYIINARNILLKLVNKVYSTSIKNVYFNYKNDYYELEIDYFWKSMPHSIIHVEIIYSQINIFNYIFFN